MWRTVIAVAAMAPSAAWSADLIQVARETGNYTRFIEIVDRAQLTGELTSGGPYTVFMPSDVAFERMPPETTDRLASVDREVLRPIVLQHVIRGVALPSDDIPKTLQTAGGGELQVTWELNGLNVYSGAIPPVGEKARVVRGDLKADNGVVHTIDAMLLPVGALEIEKAAPQAASGTRSDPPSQAKTQPQRPAEKAAGGEAAKTTPPSGDRTTRVYTYVPKPVSPPTAVAVIPAPAEPQRAERVGPRPVALSVEELEDMTVVSNSRDAEGVVEGVIITPTTGEIDALLIRFSGFMGMFGKLIVVPWSDITVAKGQPLLIADIDAATIERAEQADLSRYEVAG